MKTFLLTIISLFTLQMTKAQTETVDFDGSLFRIEIDTAYAENIWQVGRPSKTFFDSAYSAPNAIVTDTVNFYPINNQSSFTLGFNLSGSQPTIDFTHKFDTDSSFDGGFVEFSFDQGATWTHLTAQTNEWDAPYAFETSNFYNETDTLQNGKPAFSGRSDDWQQSRIVFWCMAVKTDFWFYLRFNFSSDSIQSDLDGWMIDDIVIQDEGVCSGISEYSKNTNGLKISPNPFHEQTTVTVVEDVHIRNGTFAVFDIFGRTISTQKQISGSQFTFNGTGLKSGIYSYLLKDENGLATSGKFVVK